MPLLRQQQRLWPLRLNGCFYGGIETTNRVVGTEEGGIYLETSHKHLFHIWFPWESRNQIRPPLSKRTTKFKRFTLLLFLILVPATSIAPKLSSNAASDRSQVISVPEEAANAVIKFADNSLRLRVGAGKYSGTLVKKL